MENFYFHFFSKGNLRYYKRYSTKFAVVIGQQETRVGPMTNAPTKRKKDLIQRKLSAFLPTARNLAEIPN